MRIYSDIDHIVERYQDRPVQRSLKKLQSMGIKSGITIPLSQFGLHSGILFLNSIEVGAFDHLQDADYSTICLMKMAANNLLYRFIYNSTGVDNHLMQLLEGFSVQNVFDPSEFQSCMNHITQEKFSNKPSCEIDFDSNAPKILFNFLPIVYLLVRSLEMGNYFFENSKLSISIRAIKNGDGYDLKFIIPKLSLDLKKLAYLETLNFLPDQSLQLTSEGLVLVNKVDPALGNVDYSV